MMMLMEGEFHNLVMVWATALVSACYCYGVSKSTSSSPKGKGGLLRLLLVLPVVSLLTALPFSLTTCHLAGTSFFFLTWLGSFKLLLFSFGVGPLSLPGISLPQFVCTLLFPIKLKPPPSGSSPSPSLAGWAVFITFVVKPVGFACLFQAYKYKERLPEFVVTGLYSCHMFLAVEFILGISWALSRVAIGPGVEIAPQSNQPYLSTSLQDFWGRRWNLMTSDIIKQSVHIPIRNLTSPLVGKKCAAVAGLLSSFLVSALMHEILYYHFTHKRPTWEVTWLFILHGVCIIIEVMAKTAVPAKWQLPPAISTLLTLGFMGVTFAWLLFPQLARNKVFEKGVDEYYMLANYVWLNVLYWFKGC